MADPAVAELLKNFALNLTTSAVKEREKIIGDLLPCVSKPEFPESGIKGICKHLLFTLPLYQDGKSRRVVLQLINNLATCHAEKTSKYMVAALKDIVEDQKKASYWSSHAPASLNALDWTCVLVRSVYKSSTEMTGDAFQKLVEFQMMLLYGALATRRCSIKAGAYRKMSRIWKEVNGSVEQYQTALSKQEGSVYQLCIMACITRHLHEIKDRDKIDSYRESFVEQYSKQVIGSRSRASEHVLECSNYILREMNHENFKGILLPAVERAMLRNPELVLLAFKEMLAGVTIDLSQYATELGKVLGAHCQSKDEVMQQIAVDGCKNMAKQCSDGEAVQKIVKLFFAILGGSEGKLALTSQRCGMMLGVGYFSYNGVGGGQSMQQLASQVTEQFIPVLQQEVHEGTLIQIISSLSLWCAKFTTDVPTKLVEWFKKGYALKSSTSSVRTSYIQCMTRAFSGDRLFQGIAVIPLLLGAVEKAAAQSTQIPLVTEGLAAACLLVNLSLSDIQAESKLTSFWTLLLDVKKQLFVNEKFLSSCSDSALKNVASLVERLVLEHSQKMIDPAGTPFYQALIYTLTHGSYSARKHAQSSTRKILGSLGGSKTAVSLIKQFRIVLQQQTLSDPNQFIAEGAASPDTTNCINPRILSDTLQLLAVHSRPESGEAEVIALEILQDCHHPCIVAHNSDLWTDLLYSLKVNPKEFISSYIKNITTDLRNSTSISEAQKSTVSTLVRVAAHCVLPPLVSHTCDLLATPELCTVTLDEYRIMQHKEGDLYNKSVLQGVAQAATQAQNIKRENKLYSYAEQMAEIKLQQEIDKKKNKAKPAEPQLTKKQKEVLEAQLKVESNIRAKCKQLDLLVEKACDLIFAFVDGCPLSTRLHLLELLRSIIPALSSPLAAPRLVSSFVELSDAAFEACPVDDFFALMIGHCSLRLIQPACELDVAWSGESIDKQTVRAVTELYQLTVPSKSRATFRAPFPAPTFAYCFYLLRTVLTGHATIDTLSETLLLKALAIVSTHAQLRSDLDDDEAIDETGPELLPREEMLRMCCQIIGSTSGRVQQQAARTLLDTATSASGDEGCTTPEPGEITALLEALQSSASPCREASLMALEKMSLVLPTMDTQYDDGLKLLHRIWIARFDTEEENKNHADQLWEEAGLETCEELCLQILPDLMHHESVIRTATAEALGTIAEEYPDNIDALVTTITDLYHEKLKRDPPVMDPLGRVVKEASPDEYDARCGLAQGLEKLAPFLPPTQIDTLFEFYVHHGLRDRIEEVRKFMLNAAVAAVNEHGKNHVNGLLPLFEDFLSKAPNNATYDAVRQSIVVLMGTLAKHLDKSDPKVKPIVAKLIETLSTPSQQVQEAVASCLPPLVPAIKKDAPGLVKKLMALLLESNNYGERKGAAYGLAGLVKGLGILALKQLEIMNALTEAIQNKKNPRHREGALFAFEMLCMMLGRLFEPYVVHLLPHLLLCFGDANGHVRSAADDTAKAVMSKLSAHGVKMVLPSLLKALEEDSWRTKTGSVELLGAMAFCAPKQLSACLPSIVPKLSEVLTDSHLKVQKAGAQALKQIGSVIRNPEIQAIVPTLLEALQDPTKKTTTSLQRLLDTKFVHFIDAPSLALIMPVVQRAFQDRSTETRKMAAQIIGNMYSLTDQKDLHPYLPSVIPGLKQSLLDPVPEVRSVSARALGTMVKGMGEEGFRELVPWLMETLASENSSVDRSGAAQGLSEVVGGLGIEKLNKLMPDIITTTERTDIAPHIRDGYIMMYIYLPSSFGDDFIPFLGAIIPSILKALADESEFVRDTALRAGQRIINMYADNAIELLLPELERGLFDDNWRIRYSSVQLLGDLLYKISGVSGKMTTETAGDDDNFGTESSQQAILSILGEDRRNRVLAGLYMGRSDTALMVRQAALHVWKIIVSHTPKTLREILSTLFQLLLGCLASTSYDKRQVAARTLGDIVRKLGEKVLPEIIPILEQGLRSEDSDQRQGVCIGLSEIMSSTSKEHVIVYGDSLVNTVRQALCDPLPEVREAAAHTFDNLHLNIGTRALDDILPKLLKQLENSEHSEYALDGLKQVMAVKSRVVLPYLIPQLTSPPVNTRALSFLSSVAGEALTRHLGRILPALMSALSKKRGTPEEAEELEYCETVVLSVADDQGVRTVMDELLTQINTKENHLRYSAVTILHVFCANTKADLSDFVPQLLRGLIHMFMDSDVAILNVAWDCLNAVTKKLDGSEMLGHITDVRQALRFTLSDFKGNELPGFCLPKKGITPILPIFREGILNGPPELKESAAIGLGEVIKRTSADALKPSVVHITGPLIRILGDRFSFNVKVAVLETLGLLLGKCGVMLKPFLPQLQTTFIKALNDPHRAVRLRAADALGRLISIHTRVDPLFTELQTGMRNTDDSAIRDTMLQALRGCIAGAGEKMGVKVRAELSAMLQSMLSVGEDTTRTTAAACFGTLCGGMGPDDLANALNTQLLDADASQDWVGRHGKSVALAIALKTAAEKLTTDEWALPVSRALITYGTADRVPICLSGIRGIGYYLKCVAQQDGVLQADLLNLLSKCMKQESNDKKQLGSQVVEFIARSVDHPLDISSIKQLIPMLVNGTKEKNTAVRSYSETALVNLLKMREGDTVLQSTLNSLDAGMRDSLNEVASKALKKIISQPDTGDRDIDDTFLV